MSRSFCGNKFFDVRLEIVYSRFFARDVEQERRQIALHHGKSFALIRKVWALKTCVFLNVCAFVCLDVGICQKQRAIRTWLSGVCRLCGATSCIRDLISLPRAQERHPPSNMSRVTERDQTSNIPREFHPEHGKSNYSCLCLLFVGKIQGNIYTRRIISTGKLNDFSSQ